MTRSLVFALLLFAVGCSKPKPAVWTEPRPEWLQKLADQGPDKIEWGRYDFSGYKTLGEAKAPDADAKEVMRQYFGRSKEQLFGPKMKCMFNVDASVYVGDMQVMLCFTCNQYGVDGPMPGSTMKGLRGLKPEFERVLGPKPR